MRRLTILFAAVLLLCSCSTTYTVRYRYNTDDGFIGMTYPELVDLFGSPTYQTPNGTGGTIVSFENCDRYFDYKPNYVSAAGKAPTVQFYLDEDGACYRVFTANTSPVKVHSTGKTVALILVLLLIPII